MIKQSVATKSRSKTIRKTTPASGRSKSTASVSTVTVVAGRKAKTVGGTVRDAVLRNGDAYVIHNASVGAKHRAAAGSVVKVKATTVRLAPALQLGLEMLQGVLKKPVNKMVNEAVESFIEKRTVEVQSDLETLLSQIKAYRRKDPDFKLAIGQFVDAEASLGGEDPAEGAITRTASARTGPSQTMVRALLNS